MFREVLRQSASGLRKQLRNCVSRLRICVTQLRVSPNGYITRNLNIEAKRIFVVVR